MRIMHQYRPGRRWVAGLPHGADLLETLESFAAEQGVKVGKVELIGAVEKGVIAFYDQDKKQYGSLEFPEPLEILNCIGTISLREGVPRAHLHIIFGRHDGSTLGGHLMPGTVVFAAEAVMEELTGPDLQRGFDSQTGLPLWEENKC